MNSSTSRIRERERRWAEERRRDALVEIDKLEEAVVRAYEVLSVVGLNKEQLETLGDLMVANNTFDQITGSCDLIRDALSDPDGRL